MASEVAIPSPAGIEYQIAHISDDQGPDVLAAFSVNFALSCIAVTLRLAARRICKVQLLADDYFVLAALVIATGELVIGISAVRLGIGKHVILLKDPIAYGKDIYATELLYVVGTALVKFAILSLYRRIFGVSRRFGILLWTTGALIFVNLVIAFFMALFQCRPINDAWDRNVEAKCMNVELWSLVIGIINVCLDFGVLFLPIGMVWGVQMKLKWKLQIVGMFMLGGFVCLGSTYRITTLHKITDSDATWEDVPPAIWAMVEICIGIVSACLPTLRPVFNLLIHGHHCSSREHGYCTRCNRNKPGPNPSDRQNSDQSVEVNMRNQMGCKAGRSGLNPVKVHVKRVGSEEGSFGEKLGDVERLAEGGFGGGVAVQGGEDRSREQSFKHGGLQTQVPSDFS